MRFLYRDNGRQSLCQTSQVPQADLRLLIKGVSSAMVRVITNKSRVVGFHETEWTIIESQPEDRHVVRIHHAMCETDSLPLSHQTCGARDDLIQETQVLVWRIADVRKMLGYNIISEQGDRFVLIPISEDLKRTETHMRR